MRTSRKLDELLAGEGSNRRYRFLFLSPIDYDDFFAGLRDGSLAGFVSTLQAPSAHRRRLLVGMAD